MANNIEIVGLVTIVLSIWLSARVRFLWASTPITNWLYTAHRCLVSVLTCSLVVCSIHGGKVVFGYDRFALSNLHKLLSCSQIASVLYISRCLAHEWLRNFISCLRGKKSILFTIELKVCVRWAIDLWVTGSQMFSRCRQVNLTLHVFDIVNGLASTEPWESASARVILLISVEFWWSE